MAHPDPVLIIDGKRRCTKCNEWKDIGAHFHILKNGKPYPRCQSCKNQDSREWIKNNKERRKAIYQKWKDTHPGAATAATMNWRSNNRERHNKVYMEYHHSRKSDPAYKIKRILRSRIYMLLKGSKSAHAMDLIGCDMVFLMNYLANKFQPGMSWENHGEWHIDHHMPLSSFNLLDPAQQKIAFHYSNLNPLWAVENIRKRGKIPVDS